MSTFPTVWGTLGDQNGFGSKLLPGSTLACPQDAHCLRHRRSPWQWKGRLWHWLSLSSVIGANITHSFSSTKLNGSYQPCSVVYLALITFVSCSLTAGNNKDLCSQKLGHPVIFIPQGGFESRFPQSKSNTLGLTYADLVWALHHNERGVNFPGLIVVDLRSFWVRLYLGGCAERSESSSTICMLNPLWQFGCAYQPNLWPLRGKFEDAFLLAAKRNHHISLIFDIEKISKAALAGRVQQFVLFE